LLYKIENKILKKEPFENPPKLFVPKDKDDIRNFAITLLYKDNEEQVYRHKAYRYHIDYLYRLSKKSEILYRYIPYTLEKEKFEHYAFDLTGVKNGATILYADEPEKMEKEEYTCYIPETLSNYQKDFLKKRLKYFQQLKRITLLIYKKENDDLKYYKRINEYQYLTPYQTLKKMIQKN